MRTNEKLERWKKFYDKSSPIKKLFLVNYPDPTMPKRPHLWPEHWKARADWGVKKYHRLLERSEFLQDDLVPYLDPVSGTETFAEAMGCSVHRPKTSTSEADMPFALAFVHSAEEAQKVAAPKLSESSLTTLFAIADRMRDKAGPNILFRLPDIQSPLDIAALVWEKTSFYQAMIEEPKSVDHLVSECSKLLEEFLDQWFINHGKVFVSHFPEYMMFSGVSISEDEVGALSPTLFKEQFLNSLVHLSMKYDGIGIHCCARSRHQWQNFLAIPGLRMVNICLDAVESSSLFTDAGICQIPGGFQWQQYGDPEQWLELFPKESRLVLNIEAKDEREAIELSKKLRDACDKANES